MSKKYSWTELIHREAPKFGGDMADLKKTRRWRSELEPEEIERIKKLMGPLYTEHVKSGIEYAALEFFNLSNQARRPLMSEEKNRAELFIAAVDLIVDLWHSPKDMSRYGPKGFSDALQDGDLEHSFMPTTNALLMYKERAEKFLEDNKELPTTSRADPKKFFGYLVIDTLRDAGLEIVQSKNSLAYEILVIAFQLLGDDAIDDPSRILSP